MYAERTPFTAFVGIGSLITLVVLFFHELPGASQWSHLDIATYLTAATALRDGSDPYLPVSSWIAQYSGGSLQADYYVYAPFFALLLVPLTFIPRYLAVIVWAVCNMLFLGGIVACTLRATGRPTPLWLFLALTAAIALLSSVRMDLQWGETDILLALLVSSSFAAARANHSLLSGFLLASAIVIKPLLLGLLLFFLWKRAWRIVLSAIVAMIVLFLAPFLIVSRRELQEQLAIWRFWSNYYTPFIDNISPKGVLARLLTDNPNGPGIVNRPVFVLVLWTGLLAVLTLVVLVMTSRQAVREKSLPLAEFSLAVCTALIASPLTEWIYLTLLTIPFLLCASIIRTWGMSRSSAKFGIVLLLVYGALCMPLNHIEYWAWPRIAIGGIHGVLWVLVASIYLYPLIATYALSVVVLSNEARKNHLLGYERSPFRLRSGGPIGGTFSTPTS